MFSAPDPGSEGLSLLRSDQQAKGGCDSSRCSAGRCPRWASRAQGPVWRGGVGGGGTVAPKGHGEPCWLTLQTQRSLRAHLAPRLPDNAEGLPGWECSQRRQTREEHITLRLCHCRFSEQSQARCPSNGLRTAVLETEKRHQRQA